jgi:multiple sugar transport system substrate-binding protein
MLGKKAAIIATTALLGASVLAACGNAVDAGTNEGTGAITLVTGKDNSNLWPQLQKEWNRLHPKEKVTVRQQTDQADQQLSDLQQHFLAKDPGYDVVTVDVVWTAEFAARKWLVPLTGSRAIDTSPLLPATVKAATYAGKLFAAPYASDGGLLYYRKDIVSTPPKTWTAMIAACKGKTTNTITSSKPACYAGQFANYEGLTVNAAEAINAAGGTIVKSDGVTPDVDSKAAAEGLGFLANGFKQGYIPREAIGFQEEQSLNAFESGHLVFMRNWPYADAILSSKDSKVVGKFGIAPLPGPHGHGASSLGGHSLAISAFSRHQKTALAFLKWMEEPAQQRYNLVKGTLAPVVSSLYTDRALVKAFPYLPTLLASIKTAVPRPVSPFYQSVTQAIETNSYAALQGTTSTTQALRNMQAALNTASA